MIYINKDTNILQIPRHNRNVQSIYNLILVNNYSKDNNLYQNLEDVSQNKYFYEFNIDCSQLIDGEYTYKLLNNDDTEYEHGLLVCGELNNINITYNKNNDNKVYERN